MPRKRLLVGLGNPGKTYEFTRHNAGFLLLDELARRQNATFRSKKAWHGDVALLENSDILLKPDTFMNESGRAVAAALKDLPPDTELIVILDDADLPLGSWRFRDQGSSAGQKGLQSILESLGKDRLIPRVRIGIGRPTHPEMSLADWVLSRFTKEEENTLKTTLDEVIAFLIP